MLSTYNSLQELFIKSLASEGYKDTNDKKRLEYKNLASVVHNSDRYEFLREIMPKKITVRQYRELMARKQQKLNNSTNPSAAGKDSSSSSSSSSSTSSTTSDSSSSSSDDESDTSNDKSSLVKKWVLVSTFVFPTFYIFVFYLFEWLE